MPFTFTFDKIIIEYFYIFFLLHLGRSEVEQTKQKKVRFIFIFVVSVLCQELQNAVTAF